MNGVQDIIERSRRHHQAEQAGGKRHIPGQTLGHFGGGTLCAKVTRTLRKEDLVLGITAFETYKIKLLSTAATTADAWVNDHWYAKDAMCGSGGKIYKAKDGHYSHYSNAPPGASWEEFTGEVEAGIFHYKPESAWAAIKLTETVPWFNVNDIVEVIQYQRAGDLAKKWYIIGTVANTVYTEINGTRHFSITQHSDAEGKSRSISCFA